MVIENYLIIAKSTEGMLNIFNTLRINKIECQMVPAPHESGTVCAVAIKVSKDLLDVSLEILKEKGIRYQSIFEDKKLKLQSLLDKKLGAGLTNEFLDIINKIGEGNDLSKDEIAYLIRTENPKEIDIIFNTADKIRKEVVGDVVDIRGAIEFSNYCRKNCRYCGLAARNDIKRYRMSEDDILKIAKQIYSIGIKTVILQSGEDSYYTVDKLISIIKRIKSETGMRVTLSIGERSFEEYELLKKAGANNFLLKIESTNEKLFGRIHPDDDYNTRKQCSIWLKQLGYINGSGNIIGLPGQTIEDIADDILYFKDMGINMIGIGPFVPAKGSEFEDCPQGSVELTLKTIAVTRIVCKRVYIPATTALASIDDDGQEKALRVGANTIMLINTPIGFRENYSIYNNKNMVDLKSALDAVHAAGRVLPEYIDFSEANL
jgi:biotin synthase